MTEFKCDFCDLNFKLSCRLSDHLKRNQLCNTKQKLHELNNQLNVLQNECLVMKENIEMKEKLILELKEKNELLKVNKNIYINYGNINNGNINNNNFFITNDNFTKHLNTLNLDNKSLSFKKKFDITYINII